MGFPIAYTEVYLPKFLIHILTLLGLIRNLISTVFRFVGLGDFLEPDFSNSPDPYPTDSTTTTTSFNNGGVQTVQSQSASALIIREFLPVVKFSDLVDPVVDPTESCAVCLYEFDAGDEIRQLSNCRHVFHRCCLDRWMDHDQKTCPLCRTPLIPDDLQDSFNERLWAASGIDDYYGDGESSEIGY